MRLIAISLVILLSLGSTAAFAGATEPTTDEQKTLYALGLAISQSLGTFSLNESELELEFSDEQQLDRFVTHLVFSLVNRESPQEVRWN